MALTSITCVSLVLVFHDVTMKYKTPNDFRVGKWNDHFCSTRLSVLHGWNAKGVAQAVESGGDAIDFGDQKSGLMDMEIVVLGIVLRIVHSSVSPSLTVTSVRFSSNTLSLMKKRVLSGLTENAKVRRCAIGLDRTIST